MDTISNASQNTAAEIDDSDEGLSAAQHRLRRQLAEARARENERQTQKSPMTFFTRKDVAPDDEPTIDRAPPDDDMADAQEKLRTHLNALRARSPQAGADDPDTAPYQVDPTGDGDAEARRRLRLQLAQARAREPELRAGESRAAVLRRNAIAGSAATILLAALVIFSWDSGPDRPIAVESVPRMPTAATVADGPGETGDASSDAAAAIPPAQYIDSAGQPAPVEAEAENAADATGNDSAMVGIEPTLTENEPAQVDTGQQGLGAGPIEAPPAVENGDVQAAQQQAPPQGATDAAADVPITPSTVRPRRKPPVPGWADALQPEMTQNVVGTAQ